MNANVKTKNKMGGIKIPNFYASPLNKNGITVGENTGRVQKDKKGEYVLRTFESVGGQKGDTIRPANNKTFKPAVIGKSLGSKDGYLIGGDYNVQKTGDKNYNISPTNRNKFGGTPDNTDKQAAYEKAQDQLFAEGKITFTWDGSDPDDGDTLVYTLYVDTIDGKQTPLASQTGLSVKTLDVALVEGSTYYWRVKTFDGKNNSYSVVRSFKTK